MLRLLLIFGFQLFLLPLAAQADGYVTTDPDTVVYADSLGHSIPRTPARGEGPNIPASLLLRAEGTVCVIVWLAPSGSVVRTDIDQLHSTTFNRELVNRARRWAMQFKYNPLSASAKQEEQCASITFKFVLK